MTPKKGGGNKAKLPERTHALHLLGNMLRIRRMEEKCAELYSATKIRGFMHLYDGEEAVAVGVLENLAPEDAVVATYREHGHALIRGVPMGAILAEMYGKKEGCSLGRGGSMHLFDAATSFYGGNAIVGGGLPLAVGLALAYKLRGEKRIACCFFGDGAVAEGEFHESMNLAALWKLPVLFVCENNLYAMGTALAYEHAVTDIASKAANYGIAASAVDGMDLLAVEESAATAATRIRRDWSPYLLECRTYRFRAHSMYDAELYRTKAEVEEWKQRCPISSFVRAMEESKVLTEEDVAEIERIVTEEIAAAVAFAESCSWEPVEDLTKFVYSERRAS